MSAKISKAVRDAIADPFTLGDEQPGWTLPAVLPPIAEVREALTALRADLEPTPAKDARWCLAKMRQRFGIGTAEIDATAWLQALQAFPKNMIFEAVRVAVSDDKRPTLESFTRHPGLVRRQTDLARAEAILAKLMAPKPVATFQREPKEVRLRTLRNSLRRVGQHQRAAEHERELAALESREPESWVNHHGADRDPGFVRAPDLKLPAPSAKTQAALNRAAAKRHREEGRVAIAALLEREADALVPVYAEEPLGDEQGEAA